MTGFAAYSHAIASMALFALVALALGPMAARAKAAAGVVSGAGPVPDYADPVYRLWRAYQNATEIAGVFCIAVMAAILAGAAPVLVNWLASLFLVSRLAHAFVHVRGIGAANFGPRTFLFVFGWAMCAGLALAALWSVFLGGGA